MTDRSRFQNEVIQEAMARLNVSRAINSMQQNGLQNCLGNSLIYAQGLQNTRWDIDYGMQQYRPTLALNQALPISEPDSKVESRTLVISRTGFSGRKPRI